MSQGATSDWIRRRPTKPIKVGPVGVGGGAPISVQTMTKTDTRDVAATVAQIAQVAAVGCDIVRLAVVDEAAARALAAICSQVAIPVVADIHFNHKLALLALEGGVAGLRINPGNIGSTEKVREVVAAAKARQVPIRIGVNSGSVEKDILKKHGGATASALVESALRHVAILEKLGYDLIKLSVKASDVPRTVEAYRLLSRQTGYPLHLGVTEAGTAFSGSIRSAVALGILLKEGIGDTIRVSLSAAPDQEVRVGLEILRSLGLRAGGPRVISCPTCGRIEVNVVRIAAEVEGELEKLHREDPTRVMPVVAVMGCAVNGPGEAREADIAIAGGAGRFALFVGGEHQGNIEEERAVAALLAEVRRWMQTPRDR